MDIRLPWAIDKKSTIPKVTLRHLTLFNLFIEKLKNLYKHQLSGLHFVTAWPSDFLLINSSNFCYLYTTNILNELFNTLTTKIHSHHLKVL